jgi:hypothetical protein
MWHWDRFFSELFGFLLSIFHRGSPRSYGMRDRPVGGRSSETSGGSTLVPLKQGHAMMCGKKDLRKIQYLETVILCRL